MTKCHQRLQVDSIDLRVCDSSRATHAGIGYVVKRAGDLLHVTWACVFGQADGLVIVGGVEIGLIYTPGAIFKEALGRAEQRNLFVICMRFSSSVTGCRSRSRIRLPVGSDTVLVMKALHPVRIRYVRLGDVIEPVTVLWREHEFCCLQIGAKLLFGTRPDHHGCHFVAPE